MGSSNVNWQPWLSLFQTLGEGSNPDQVIQAKEDWLDTEGMELAIVSTEVLGFTLGTYVGPNVALQLQTCDDTGGEWQLLAAYSAQTFANTVYRKDVPDGVTKLHRWLRWRIENGDLVPWQITFRFSVALKDMD